MAQRRLYITRLPPFGAAAEQNDQRLAIPAEVDPVAGPRLIRNSDSPSLSAFAFEVLPSPRRSMAMLTSAAA